MRKLTLDEIQRDAARRGGRCLADTYVDSLTLMEWECAEGHRWRAVAHAIRQGHWCKRCADDRLRLPATAVHEVALARGGRCLAERYTNSQAKLDWECGLGHRWRSSFNWVKLGRGCPHCRADERAAARATRQANGSATAQSAAMSQNPPAPSRPYSAPEANVSSAVAPPIPTVP